MNVLIVEDEYIARENLKLMLAEKAPDWNVLAEAESIKESVMLLKTLNKIDLLFMDIQLSDGISFDIFEQVEVDIPIIFTTAYDEYAIQAFKVSSIDYLLKPLKYEELEKAIDKFQKLSHNSNVVNENILEFIELMHKRKIIYKQSFLVRKGERLIPLNADDFAFFFIRNGVVKGVTKDEKTYHFDEKLEELLEGLDPQKFIRANRQYIVQRSAIKDLTIYFNGRLIVNLVPAAPESVIVSKSNSPKIKQWLGR